MSLDRSHITITAGPVPTASVNVTLTGEHDTDVIALRSATRVMLAVLGVPAEDVEPFKTRIRDSVLGRLVTDTEHDTAPPAPARKPEPPQVEIGPDGHARVASTGEKVTGEVFYCPTCNQQVNPSKEMYQEWEPGDDGRQYPQKFFCGNDSCGTKSLWRSKLVK